MKILLTTLHAKYSHASLALPSLAANCRSIPGATFVIREWTVNEAHEHLLRMTMAEQADLVAFSCYIWNMEKTLKIVSDIKKITSDTLIVLGGPEASFGVFETMRENPGVDFIVKGEGEKVFRRLIQALASRALYTPLNSEAGQFAEIDNLIFRDGDDIVSGPYSKACVTLDSLPSPFEAGLVDLRKPLVYYETSRGCPFSCAFCLSSVEGRVRSYSMDRIMKDLLLLLRRRVPQIKLVDRTFNYDAKRAGLIWKFILKHNQGSHFHFEIAADLLTGDNLSLLKQVPDNTFRFEIGVQSASEDALEQVDRKCNLARIFENVRRLRTETGVELHLDLIAGLPGENFAGFLKSLQQVAELNPHVIQIEPLKVLKGSPMRGIARQEGYRFSSFPPYKILATPWLSFEDIGRAEIIARLLDLFYNRGGFTTALRFLLRETLFNELFNQMAGQAGFENLSGLSTLGSYELFARLAAPLVREADRRFFHDALLFDYCLNELPRMGKLPGFIEDRHKECAWPGRGDLPAGLELDSDNRVKLFRFIFLRDYRVEPWLEGEATVTFVYASAEGRGQRVMVV